MTLLGTFIGTVIDTASLPVALVKDCFTMGGILTDRSESYTRKSIRDITEDIQEIDDDLREL